MSHYETKLHWKRTTTDFKYESYDRTHEIKFTGGQTLKGSSAPEYLGKAEHANPEELLLAALSSCHMLTFLAVAAKSHLVLESYDDEATCYLEKGENGILYVTRATLRPKVVFSGDTPSEDKIRLMHEKSHKNCFIANSVTTKIAVEPIF